MTGNKYNVYTLSNTTGVISSHRWMKAERRVRIGACGGGW